MTDDALPTISTPGGLSATSVDEPETRVDDPKTKVGDPDTKEAPETEPSQTPPKPGRRKKQKGFIRRHKILIALAVLLALIAGAAGGSWWWLNHKLSSIPRVPAGIQSILGKEGAGEQHQDLNILLLGADNGSDKQTVADDLKDGTWTPFAHRSDTIMIAHIPADRSTVQLVSIPRDTWVPIDGYPYADGHGKINAAFAYGGPSLAVTAVQQLTGMHIDHVAIIDWSGFRDLTTALGGVRVYIPQTFYDDVQHITWAQGWHTLEGQEALQYVRTRHGLTNGDFGRIERQQNFMRATMQQLLASTHHVGTMINVLNTVTKFLTIDDTWQNDEIRNLALSLRSLHSSDVQFLTAPLGRYATSSDGQSIVRLDPKQSRELFKWVDGDQLQKYLDKYPDASLSGDKQIN